MKINLTKTAYILCGAIVMTSRFWGININANLRYAVCGVWSFYLLLCFAHIPNSSEKKRTIMTHFKYMFMPIFAMAIYTVVLWIFYSGIELGNYTRLISTILYLSLGWGFVGAGYYLFQKDVIDYLFSAGVISYLLGSIVYLIVSNGFSGIVLYARCLILGESNSANYAMEVHDLTFAMGIFFIYYLFSCDSGYPGRKRRIIISAIYIFLGLKRIEIAALIVTIIANYLLLKRKKIIAYRATFLAVVFSVLSYSFIYLTYSGILNEIAEALSINFKGRLSYYDFASNYYTFSPVYLGKGFTYFSRLFSNLYQSGYTINGYGIANSIHSDILVLFIENGFIFTLGWIFYSFSWKIRNMRGKYGNQVSECCLLITIYMFILYLTDNTFTYTAVQMVFMAAPLALCYKQNDIANI